MNKPHLARMAVTLGSAAFALGSSTFALGWAWALPAAAAPAAPLPPASVPPGPLHPNRPDMETVDVTLVSPREYASADRVAAQVYRQISAIRARDHFSEPSFCIVRVFDAEILLIVSDRAGTLLHNSTFHMPALPPRHRPRVFGVPRVPVTRSRHA